MIIQVRPITPPTDRENNIEGACHHEQNMNEGRGIGDK